MVSRGPSTEEVKSDSTPCSFATFPLRDRRLPPRATGPSAKKKICGARLRQPASQAGPTGSSQSPAQSRRPCVFSVRRRNRGGRGGCGSAGVNACPTPKPGGPLSSLRSQTPPARRWSPFRGPPFHPRHPLPSAARHRTSGKNLGSAAFTPAKSGRARPRPIGRDIVRPARGDARRRGSMAR